MLQEEPDVTAEERAAIVEYLSAAFKPGGRIYINLAAAKDLARLLEMPLSDAERLARYREEKGPFTDLNAIKAVPDVDTALIDRKAGDLTF